MAPLLGRAIDVSIEGGHHRAAARRRRSRGVGGFLDENRTTIRERLTKESPWWVPEPIDDRIFNKIFNGVQSFLADVAGRPRPRGARGRSTSASRALAERLRDDPVMIAKGEEIKHELLAHPEVQAWLQSLWGELKRAMLDGRRRPRQRAAPAARRRAGPGRPRACRPTPSCRPRSTTGSSASLAYVVENYKGEVADLIATTVERWDAADTSRRIELQVGRDLQFIRINGTVVGGLAGLLIHTVERGAVLSGLARSEDSAPSAVSR